MNVGIIDYGCGNLFSLENALEQVGMSHIRIDSCADAKNCQALIIPGVGSYEAGMIGLDNAGLAAFIRKWVFDGKPLLGICLGMQLLMEGSEEAPNCLGLSIIPGFTRRLWGPFAVPHIGWNEVTGAYPGTYYFVHSYYVQPTERTTVIAEVRHNLLFPAIIEHKRVLGVQFHPEKSGTFGLAFLKNWGESIV